MARTLRWAAVLRAPAWWRVAAGDLEALDADRLEPALGGEGVDLVALQRPRRRLRLAVARGGDDEQRAAGRDELADAGDRRAPRRVGQRLHGQALEDEVERAAPLGRRVEQVGGAVVDGRAGVARPRGADGRRRDVEGARREAQR